MDIAILFPSSYGRPAILRAITAVGRAMPGCVLDVSTGDTDAPSVDTLPPGGDSVVARVIESARKG